MSFYRKIGLGLVLVAIFSACAATRPQRQRYFEHEVRYQGETLSAIAGWYTGHPDDWALIVQHNPDIDVLKLRRGTIVKIPLEMVIRDDPFPKRLATAAKSPSNNPGRGGAPTNSGTLGLDARGAGSFEKAGSSEKVVAASGAGLASASEASVHTPALSAEEENDVRRKSREELFRELLPATATPGS